MTMFQGTLEKADNDGCQQGSTLDMISLRKQYEGLSEFCSLMGSLMGQFLWDLSKCPHIANTLARKDRIEEMLELVRSAILCYSASCRRSREAWPGGLSAEETRLVLSLSGLATNLAAVAPDVLASSGRKLIKDVITVIIILPAEPLRKVLLELLYNVSLDEVGASILQEKAVMIAIQNALKAGPDIRLSALKLLASLTLRQIQPSLLPQIPYEHVKTLYHTGDAEMSYYADMILKRVSPLIEV